MDLVYIRSNKAAGVYLVKLFYEDHKYEVLFDRYFDELEGFNDWAGREKFKTLKDATRFYNCKVTKVNVTKQKDDAAEETIDDNAHERWIEMQNEMRFDRYYCE